ncbi:TetR/AcrR family transcriptional regulator [Blastococcus goldschmidtiae]|uniref:TetR/AcrR family transcriptional regulator n=1 Tax=Blastococcus goldschmidtiae TaxID=3075546 RepID=A0ABU2K3R8_9ACTN|nr:TetR/AcrR family transcriptional regulator [Blastococcus sp. DSM 46792]MDT0274822.1 TetR/AcrR family transcriptional regulator [Blastococcus sp. DSM 46792]
MPKIVDHDERRRSLIEATWRVIAREGIASATTRGIAREAGCSSGVLAHYFADKAELMASAMLAAHAEVHARLDPELTGLASVRQYMLECLPLDERRRFLAVVEVSFWGQAVGNSRLIDVYAGELDGFRGKLRVRLAQAYEQGELRPEVDVEAVVHELHVLNDGLSSQAALYPHSASAEQQTAMLDAILDRIRSAVP